MSRRASRPLVAVAGAVLALTAACGGSDTASSAAGSSSAAAPSAASASAAPSSSASAAPSSGAPSPGAPTTTAPDGSVGAATPAPGATIPPGLPTTGGDGGTAPTAGGVPQVASVDPAKGQTFLDALHAGGLPAGPTDQINLQYAPVICGALANGSSPQDVRGQLLSLGQLYQSVTQLTADQIADLFLSSAQRTYC